MRALLRRLMALTAATAAAFTLPLPAAAATGVEVSDYTLGDQAFRLDGFDTPTTTPTTRTSAPPRATAAPAQAPR